MAPALRVPVSVNMQQFEQQMGQMGQVTSRVVKTMRNEFIKLNAEIAVQGVKALGLFGLEIIKVSYQTGLLTASLRTLVRTALPIALVVGSFEAIAAITEFAKGKIEEFVKVQEKASAAGVTTDFFQRWVEGGKAIKLSVEDATAALNKFAAAAQSKLGGSDLQKRIVELQEAGNLGGVSTRGFEGAIGNQDKLVAAAKIIREMLDKGERLAALDLAEKAFGPKVADNLRADAGYLDQMLASAKAIEATKIINQDDINRAVDLTNRLDAAQRLLAEKWVPLQKQILSLGLDYNESWIKFYGLMASTVSAATSLLGVFGQIGDKLKELGAAPYWDKALRAAAGAVPVVGPLLGGIGGALTGGGGATDQKSPAEKALSSSLVNPALIEQAKRQATELQSLMRGDTSKPTGQAKAAAETDFLGKQNEQIEKHIGLMNADAEAVGLGAGKREELRTVSLLMTAAEKDGVTVTEEMKLAMQALGEQAGKSAERLAEVQHKLQQVNQLGQTLGSSLSTAFADAVLEGKKLNEVLSQMLKTLAKAAINWAIMAPFTAGPSGGASLFASLFGFGGTGGTGVGGIGHAAGGTSFAAGGMTLVGEQGPELVNLPRGSQVIPNDATRAMMGTGGSIVYSPAIDARGASVEAVARLAQVLEQDRATFATRTIATIQQARRGRVAGL
jgi:hypothetical protein